MSWRYSSSSYTPRDTSTSRFSSGISSLSSKFESPSTERQSRWGKSSSTSTASSSEPTARSLRSADSSPVWAKASITDNPSSVVQRLKDKYNTTDLASKSQSDRLTKMKETKEFSTSLPGRSYGRTTTSFNSIEPDSKKEKVKEYGERKTTSILRSDDTDTCGIYSRFRRKTEKSPEPEKPAGGYEYRTRKPDYTTTTSNYGPLENRSKIYTSSSLGSSPSTTRYLTPKKYSNSPTSSYTSNFSVTLNTDRPPKPKDTAASAAKETESETEMMVVVTRETSPTEPSTSVYLRTRRADLSKGIEKKIPRPKTKPDSSEKETQTEKQEESSSKYSVDTNVRTKPWSSYLGGTGSSYGSASRYGSVRSSYAARDPVVTTSYSGYGGSTSRYDDYKRSVSREEHHVTTPKTETPPEVTKEEPKITTPSIEVLAAKPPTAARPVDTMKLSSTKPKAISPVKDAFRKSVSSNKSGSSLDTDRSSLSSTTGSTDHKAKSVSPLQFNMSSSPEPSPDVVKSKSPCSSLSGNEKTRATSKDQESEGSPIKRSPSKVKSPKPQGSLSPSPGKSLKSKEPESSISPTPSKSPGSRKPESSVSPTPAKSPGSRQPESSVSPTPAKSPGSRQPESSISPTPAKSPSSRQLESSVSPTPAKSRGCRQFESSVSPSSAKSASSRQPESSISPTPAKSPGSRQLESSVSPTPAKSLVSRQLQSSVASSPVKSPIQIRSPTPDLSQTNGSLNESSSSESSSDEASSSESESESEAAKVPDSDASSVKRSITNFLQNIPNMLLRKAGSSTESMANRSRTGLYQRLHSGSIQKINFKKIESGERAWWMESMEKVPEGVLKVLSNRSVGRDSDHEQAFGKKASGIHLTPPYLINRQFSKDMDWLKSSSEDVSDARNRGQEQPMVINDDAASIMKQCNGDGAWWLDKNDNIAGKGEDAGEEEVIHASLRLPQFPIVRQYSGEKGWIVVDEQGPHKDGMDSGVVDETVLNSGKINLNSHEEVARLTGSAVETSSNLAIDEGEEDFDVTPALRRRREQHQGGISPDNYLEDVSYQMKYNQETDKMKERSEGKKLLDEFRIECSVKDLTQKLVNGLSSPLEEKVLNLTEQDGMCGMISKAKAGLLKSQTKYDIRKSSSGDVSDVREIADLGVSEIDMYWKELVESIDRPLRLCDLDFTDLNSDDEKDLMGNCKMNGDVPPPPPLLCMFPSSAPAPPRPPSSVVKNKKTVKLFWKEVKDDPMLQLRSPTGFPLIWDELSLVVVDTQKLEHLFQSRAKDLATKKQQDQNKSKEVIVLDHKRSNAINIGMTKLPPPRAIKAAILKMDATVVNKDGIEKLLAMLPSEEEILRIQDAQTNNPDLPLGSAEQFLLTLASITEIEARLKLWAFKLEFENSEREICEPLMDLKQGIGILRGNRTFRGILSTLLAVGNFLNGYDVKGFQIDYLSKVPEVKDTVHKHSLLHHLCTLVMDKFPDSTDLYSEIGCVTRAAKVDFDELSGNMKKVEDECKLSWNHLKIIAKHEGHTNMKVKMSDFLADSAERIIVLGTVYRRVMSRFHKFILWLGIPVNRISTTRPNEIFKIISEFALEYRTTRERALQQMKKISHRERSRTRGYITTEQNDAPAKKILNSKEAKDDAKLRQLLGSETATTDGVHSANTWRRQRRETRNLANDALHANQNDDEIIETLIKTASQVPGSRTSLKERRRSRVSAMSERKFCVSWMSKDRARQ